MEHLPAVGGDHQAVAGRKAPGADEGGIKSLPAGGGLPLNQNTTPVQGRTGDMLRLADELFPAPGAGDGNFPLAPGHAHQLVALGTVEITVVPIFQPSHDLQEFPVFLIALIGVPGEGPENGPDHHAVAHHKEYQIHGRHLNPHGKQAGHQPDSQNQHIQFVRAVPSGHEAAQSRAHPGGELPEPVLNAIHAPITFAKNNVCAYYIGNKTECNTGKGKFTDCLRFI